MPTLEQEPAPYVFPTGEGTLGGEGPPPAGVTASPAVKGLVTATMLAGLGYAAEHWATPILKVTGRQRRSGIAGWLDWLADQIAKYITPGVNFVRHELSKAASHRAHDLSGFLNLMAWRWTQTQLMLAHLGVDTARALERGFYHTMPARIKQATRPLVRDARRLRVGLITTTRDLHRLQHFANANVPRHGRARLRHLENDVNDRLKPRVGRALTLSKQARRDAQRAQHDVDRVRWAAGFAGPVALFMAAARKLKLGFLTCRKFKRVGRDICGMDTSLFNGLWLGLIPILLAEDFCSLYAQMRYVGQTVLLPVANYVVDIAEEVVEHCGYTGPSASDPPGYDGAAWPSGLTVGERG
jgi:hypothetical protein